MTTPNRSETFGRLLKAGIASIANCEGKTAPVIEEDLGIERLADLYGNLPCRVWR